MKTYSECPNCGNEEEGYDIKKCKNCKFKGCRKTALAGFGWTDGCYPGGKCPDCDQRDGYFLVGHIGSDD